MSAATKSRVRPPREPPRRAPLVIGLVNNMPDGAMQATERQFEGLLGEAAGGADVSVRYLSLPEIERGEARAGAHARPLRTTSTGCPPPASTA